MKMNLAFSMLFLSVLIVQCFQRTGCSLGDSFPSYQSCVKKCHFDYCRQPDRYPSSRRTFRWIIQLLWNCYDNCRYECMWPMIRICLKNQWKVPQFGGKWPFIRWFGMQEPASAAFSFFNLVSNLYMYRNFYKTVRIASAMYWIWTLHAIVSTNTWFWSIMFHIRDIPFTERMDYIGAASLIYYTFCAFGFRMLIYQNVLTKTIFLGVCLFFFVQHVLHLIMKPFDYHYNFDTLLLIGLATGIGTMLWCLWYWRKAPHVQYAAVYVTMTIAVAALEIFDFPPIMWTFDAHSLWHLATIPLPYFMYKFAIEDCRYLRRLCHQTTVSTFHLYKPLFFLYKSRIKCTELLKIAPYESNYFFLAVPLIYQ